MIDYYRAFTNPDCEVFNCAACGAEISSNPTIVRDNDDTKDADGGHILFVGKYPGYYIVPLCPSCNSPSKEWVTLRSEAVAVEEVDAVIQDDEN